MGTGMGMGIGIGLVSTLIMLSPKQKTKVKIRGTVNAPGRESVPIHTQRKQKKKTFFIVCRFVHKPKRETIDLVDHF